MRDSETQAIQRPVRAVFTQPVKGRRSSERFPDALRGLMEERSLSYRQLAYKTHLSAGYLNHLTKGSRPVPADNVIETLAHALHVEPDFFLEYRLRKLIEVLDSVPRLADRLYSILVCEAPLTAELVELLKQARDNNIRAATGSNDGSGPDAARGDRTAVLI
jgi:transcriptional regulator with XRE-family HTH domain